MCIVLLVLVRMLAIIYYLLRLLHSIRPHPGRRSAAATRTHTVGAWSVDWLPLPNSGPDHQLVLIFIRNLLLSNLQPILQSVFSPRSPHRPTAHHRAQPQPSSSSLQRATEDRPTPSDLIFCCSSAHLLNLLVYPLTFNNPDGPKLESYNSPCLNRARCFSRTCEAVRWLRQRL